MQKYIKYPKLEYLSFFFILVFATYYNIQSMKQIFI